MRQTVYTAAIAALLSGAQSVPLDAATQLKVDRNLVGYDPNFVRIASLNNKVPEVIHAEELDIDLNISSVKGFLPEGKTSAAANEKRYINGGDERYIFSSTDYPYSNVGKIYWSNGVYCSGTLVGPRHVLTAKHCWVDGATGTFAPGFDNGARLGSATIQTAAWYNIDNGSDGCNTQHDFMIAIIDNRLGDNLGYFGAKVPDSSKIDQNIFTHMGYPGDVEDGNRPVREDGNRILPERAWDCGADGPYYTDTDCMGGQSGGPHWETVDGLAYAWGALSVSISDGASAWSGWGSGNDLVGLLSTLRSEYP